MSTSEQIQRAQDNMARLQQELETNRAQLNTLQEQKQQEEAQQELVRRAQAARITQGELEDMLTELHTVRAQLHHAKQDLEAASKTICELKNSRYLRPNLMMNPDGW
jgi:chromosome segregation ATPase